MYMMKFQRIYETATSPPTETGNGKTIHRAIAEPAKGKGKGKAHVVLTCGTFGCGSEASRQNIRYQEAREYGPGGG